MRYGRTDSIIREMKKKIDKSIIQISAKIKIGKSSFSGAKFVRAKLSRLMKREEIGAAFIMPIVE